MYDICMLYGLHLDGKQRVKRVQLNHRFVLLNLLQGWHHSGLQFLGGFSLTIFLPFPSLRLLSLVCDGLQTRLRLNNSNILI